MKTRLFTAIGLLTFLLLCLVPNGTAQTCVQFTQGASAGWNIGLKCSFNSASTPVSFNASGSLFWHVFFVPSGTVSAATLSIDSSATGLSSAWTTGGIISAASIGSMTAAGAYSNSTQSTPSNFGQLTPTITGSGTVTVVLFGYTDSPASSGGSSGNVNVTNFPATQAVTQTTGTNLHTVVDSGTVTATNPSVGSTGSAVPASGTTIAGKNGSGNLQDVATDSSGNVGVNVQNFPASQAVSQATGTNLHTVVDSGTVTATGSGNFNNASIGATGSAVPASATVVAAKNGSGNAQDLAVDLSANLNVDVAAGAAIGATGAAVPSSAELVAGKNGSGNTQAISTDSNGNVGVNIQNTTATSGATNITASQCAVVAVGGSSQIAVVVSGTWTGTLQPKVSIDGTNYVNAVVFATFPTGSGTGTITANGQWVLLPFGANSAEVCGNTVATGTAVVTLNATPGAGAVLDNVSLWAGSLLGVPSAYGTSPGAVNVPGVNAYVTNIPAVTQSGTWSDRINGSTGVALDSAAGATAPTNALQISGVYNSSAPAPSAGQAEPLQMDGSGDIYVAFRSTTNGCTGNNSSFASILVNFSGTSLTQAIALAAGKKIYICAAYLQGGGTTPTLEFEYGTGTNCATGTTVLTQPVALTTAAPGISWSSPGPVVPVGDALCYLLTGTSPTVVGWLSYVQ